MSWLEVVGAKAARGLLTQLGAYLAGHHHCDKRLINSIAYTSLMMQRWNGAI